MAFMLILAARMRAVSHYECDNFNVTKGVLHSKYMHTLGGQASHCDRAY